MASSLTVQTWTGSAARWAAARKRAVTIAIRPAALRDLHAVGAQLRHPAAGGGGARDRDGGGPIDVQARPRLSARTRASRRSENDADADAVPGSETIDQRHERRHAGVRLGVDVDPRAGPAHQQLLQPRNLNPATAERDAAPAVRREGMPRVGGLDPGDVELGDRAVTVGDAVEPGVVEGDEHAVAGDVRIGLEVAIAERDRALERGERVLGRLPAPPAVRDGDRRYERCHSRSILRRNALRTRTLRGSTTPTRRGLAA